MSQKVRSVLPVMLLTLLMGLGIPIIFGYAYTLDGVYEWGGGLLAAGFVGLPFLVWPGYEMYLTLWACKEIRWRWFLPVLFPILLMATCGLWVGWLWPVFVVMYAVVLAFSVIAMFVTVSSGTKE